MRRASVAFLLTVLVAGTGTKAVAQDAAARRATPAAPAVEAPSGLVVPTQPDSAKVRKPDAGPRLPEFVPSIPVPGEAEPPAPSGNLVIPVTTVLIVLLALVVLLIIAD